MSLKAVTPCIKFFWWNYGVRGIVSLSISSPSSYTVSDLDRLVSDQLVKLINSQRTKVIICNNIKYTSFNLKLVTSCLPQAPKLATVYCKHHTNSHTNCTREIFKLKIIQWLLQCSPIANDIASIKYRP